MNLQRVLFAAALALALATTAGPGTAHAAGCLYMAHNQFGQSINGIFGRGHARRKSRACRRARRRCNRRLERALRRGAIHVSTRGAKCREISGSVQPR
jgi:hypothetical protein